MALGFSGNTKDSKNLTEGRTESKRKGNEAEEVESLNASDDYGTDRTGNANRRNLILLAGGIVILLAIGVGAVSYIQNKGSGTSSSNTETADGAGTGEQNAVGGNAVYDEYGNLISENGIYTPEGEVIDDNAINPGITDYEDSNKNSTTPYVYDASEYIKDLNGLDVSAVYNVQSRSYVKDYVNYESRRAIIDDGMELYWLEVMYKQKKYRVQVPFYYFKDLATEGICKVEMEVLTLEGGEKIISYMQVIRDEG